MKRLIQRLASVFFICAFGVVASAQTVSPDAPRPFKERQTIRVGIPGKLEAYAALHLADALGEFEKENVTIQYFTQKPSDGLLLLATGRIDVLANTPTAAFFNAVAGGSELKMVVPSGFQAPGNRSGFWLSRNWLNGRPYTPILLKGQQIPTPAGPGAVLDYGIQLELEKAGLSITDVTGRSISVADILPALEAGAINVGYLFDGFWQKADQSKVVFGFGGAPDISGGFFYGPNLLRDRRDLGEAFVRAFLRATKTYLQGNYHHDPRVVPALTKMLDISVEQLQSGAGLAFPIDLPIPTYAAQRLQTVYGMEPGVLSYREPLPDSRAFDRSFAAAAGATLNKIGP